MLGEKYTKYIECIQQPLRRSFRVNTLQASPGDIASQFKKKGFELSPVPWCDHAFFIEGTRFDIGNTLEKFNGDIHIQEACSMIPPLVMDLETLPENSSILDMAASPGSKTTQIAALTHDSSLIVANELKHLRLSPLKENLERCGIHNVLIHLGDGTKLEGEELYDRILVDAPCSSSGVIRKSDSALKYYNPYKLKGINKVQKELLKKAFTLAKPGAIIVYSTCSLEPEENELLVQEVLNEYTETIELVPITLDIQREFVIKEFNNTPIDIAIQTSTLRIWPFTYNTSGFFVTKFRKKTSHY